MEPDGCSALEDPCSLLPLNRSFDVFDEDLVYDGLGPQFIYVAKNEASKVKASTRVYDASRSDTTAGAFVPMPRDADFSSEGFSLVGIPAAPQFRSTLRIYDVTGQSNVEYDSTQTTPASHSTGGRGNSRTRLRMPS